MLEVTIPCSKCREPIGFGQSKCPSCGATPSPDERLALHERLTASSSDYRDLQEHIHSARTVLLIIAGVYLAVGGLGFLIHGRALVTTPHEDALAWSALIGDTLIAAAFLACWRAARAAPLAAILAAIVLWLGLQALAAATLSVSLLSGLWLKAVAAILLLRGVVASARASAFRRKLESAVRRAE